MKSHYALFFVFISLSFLLFSSGIFSIFIPSYGPNYVQKFFTLTTRFDLVWPSGLINRTNDCMTFRDDKFDFCNKNQIGLLPLWVNLLFIKSEDCRDSLTGENVNACSGPLGDPQALITDTTFSYIFITKAPYWGIDIVQYVPSVFNYLMMILPLIIIPLIATFKVADKRIVVLSWFVKIVFNVMPVIGFKNFYDSFYFFINGDFCAVYFNSFLFVYLMILTFLVFSIERNGVKHVMVYFTPYTHIFCSGDYFPKYLNEMILMKDIDNDGDLMNTTVAFADGALRDLQLHVSTSALGVFKIIENNHWLTLKEVDESSSYVVKQFDGYVYGFDDYYVKYSKIQNWELRCMMNETNKLVKLHLNKPKINVGNINTPLDVLKSKTVMTGRVHFNIKQLCRMESNGNTVKITPSIVKPEVVKVFYDNIKKISKEVKAPVVQPYLVQEVKKMIAGIGDSSKRRMNFEAVKLMIKVCTFADINIEDFIPFQTLVRKGKGSEAKQKYPELYEKLWKLSNNTLPATKDIYPLKIQFYRDCSLSSETRIAPSVVMAALKLKTIDLNRRSMEKKVLDELTMGEALAKACNTSSFKKALSRLNYREVGYFDVAYYLKPFKR